MKPHYFEQDIADEDDSFLQIAKHQGYVPVSCLLNGLVVMNEIDNGNNPCWGCNGPREKCHGKPKQ